MIFPYPPSKLNPNQASRLHWAAKIKTRNSYKLICYELAKKNIPFLPQGNIHIEITFCPSTRRSFDMDNALAAFKAGLDGIAEAWGVNDKMFNPITIQRGEVIKDGCVKIKVKTP